MASITIRNLEDSIKTKLRVQAAVHGRSIEDEALDILRSALGPEAHRNDNLAADIRARFAPLGGVNLPEPIEDEIRTPPPFDV